MKNRLLYFLSISALMISFSSCSEKEDDSVKVVVKNPSAIDRNSETIEISISQIADLLEEEKPSSLYVKDAGTGSVLVSQCIDYDEDGAEDVFIFQTDLKAAEEKSFILTVEEEGNSIVRPVSEFTTFSRFVPERTDDYTWENDKVAFRTYGPVAQKMVEDNVPGGTLSSGIDLWLKRVPYSIIDTWYAGYKTDPMFYHHDRGEGYDPYHVGSSRGTGGIGVWEHGELFTSKNFTDYRTIATGPIRTVFELDYAPWSKYGIKETKRISLDLGSNFSKFDITLSAEKEVPNYTVGITLHEGEGQVEMACKNGCFRHWEEIDGAMVGEGVVINPAVVDTAFNFVSDVRDRSQLLIVTKPQTVLSYYAGFAWEKSGQVESAVDWDAILKEQAIRMTEPIEVTIVK